MALLIDTLGPEDDGGPCELANNPDRCAPCPRPWKPLIGGVMVVALAVSERRFDLQVTTRREVIRLYAAQPSHAALHCPLLPLLNSGDYQGRRFAECGHHHTGVPYFRMTHGGEPAVVLLKWLEATDLASRAMAAIDGFPRRGVVD